MTLLCPFIGELYNLCSNFDKIDASFFFKPTGHHLGGGGVGGESPAAGGGLAALEATGPGGYRFFEVDSGRRLQSSQYSALAEGASIKAKELMVVDQPGTILSDPYGLLTAMEKTATFSSASPPMKTDVDVEGGGVGGGQSGESVNVEKKIKFICFFSRQEYFFLHRPRLPHRRTSPSDLCC